MLFWVTANCASAAINALMAKPETNRVEAARLIEQPWRIMSIGLREWAYGY